MAATERQRPVVLSEAAARLAVHPPGRHARHPAGVEVVRRNDVTAVVVVGDGTAARELAPVLEDLDAPEILVDVRAARRADPSLLTLVLQARVAAERRGRRVRLVLPPDPAAPVRRALGEAALALLFPTSPWPARPGTVTSVHERRPGTASPPRAAERLAAAAGNLERLGPRTAAARADSGPAASPGVGLTARQLEIVGYMADGLGTRQIAARLVLSVPTVRNHIAAALKALGAHTRLEAVAKARRAGLVGAAADGPPVP